MKKVLLLAMFSLMSLSMFAQSYTLKSTIGGVGAIGNQVTLYSTDYSVVGESIFVIEAKLQKMIVELDNQGIIRNKYIFPLQDGNKCTAVTLDKAGRFIIYSNEYRQLYCFQKNGTLVYRQDNIVPYFNGGYAVCFASDSKNNLYLGTKEQIVVLDANGKYVKTIGKKGTANGEFTGYISQMFIDASDNLFVVNNLKLQQFNSQGSFVSTAPCNYLGNIAMDNNGIFYGVADELKIEAFDKSGKVLSKNTFGGWVNSSYISLTNVISVVNNKLIATSGNGAAYWYAFSLDGKMLNRINKNVYDNSTLSRVQDFNFDKSGNIWISDLTRLQQFDINNKHLQTKTLIGIDSYLPIVSVKNTGDFIYNNQQTGGISSYSFTQNTAKDLLTFTDVGLVDYLNIDSTLSEVTTLSHSYYSSMINHYSDVRGIINVYDLSGTFKRKLLEQKNLMGMVRDSKGNIYGISKNDRSIYTLTVLDKTGVVQNTYDLKISAYNTNLLGITFDEYGILHIAIADGYGSMGIGIYAISKQGVVLASKLNISDSQSNYIQRSFLLKYNQGVLYLADGYSDQIFKLTYTPDSKVIKEATIQQSNITKIITDADFSLTPSSNSPASFVYSLVSGDAISLTADGKVKVLKSGVAKVKISQAATTEYAASELTIAITINLLTPTITTIQPFAKKMGDADFSIKPISTSDGAFSYSISSGDAVSVSATGVVKVLKAGKATILITQASSAKYESTTTTVDVTVTKLSQTISFAKLPSEIYHNALPLTLNASASSNLPVTLKVLSGSASIVSGLLKLTGTTGLITVEASQLGNDQYEAATALTQSVSVLLLLATEDELTKEVVLYPNPSHDYVYLRTNKVFTNYEVVNAQGITVVQRTVLNDNKIALQSLGAGLYFIKLSTKQGENTFLKFAVN